MCECNNYRDQRVASDFISACVSLVLTEIREDGVRFRICTCECITYSDQRMASDFISACVSAIPMETRGWHQIFVSTRVSAVPTETRGWRQISPGTGVTSGCEHLCGCWQPNSEPALLTVISFPSPEMF